MIRFQNKPPAFRRSKIRSQTPQSAVRCIARFHDSQRSGLIIALIALAIYAGIPTRNFYWDGVGFAQAIESGGAAPNLLLNPNHLIYNLVGYLLWNALAAAGMA